MNSIRYRGYYCGNNPVVRSDENGEFWVNIICAAAVGAGFAYVAKKLCSLLGVKKNVKKIVAAFGVAGALLGEIFGPTIVAQIASKAKAAMRSLHLVAKVGTRSILKYAKGFPAAYKQRRLGTDIFRITLGKFAIVVNGDGLKARLYFLSFYKGNYNFMASVNIPLTVTGISSFFAVAKSRVAKWFMGK